jgi:hypothetical protein
MAAIKIKLVVDKSRNRVLFADAGSDFVNLLLTFLTLSGKEPAESRSDTKFFRLMLGLTVASAAL